MANAEAPGFSLPLLLLTKSVVARLLRVCPTRFPRHWGCGHTKLVHCVFPYGHLYEYSTSEKEGYHRTPEPGSHANSP